MHGTACAEEVSCEQKHTTHGYLQKTRQHQVLARSITQIMSNLKKKQGTGMCFVLLFIEANYAYNVKPKKFNFKVIFYIMWVIMYQHIYINLKWLSHEI